MSLDRDDLAMLATSFEAAMAAAGDDVGSVNAALVELGWRDALDASPTEVSRVAFDALGRTNSPACLLDDVVGHALGIETSGVSVVMPVANGSAAPGMPHGDDIAVRGLVSARVVTADFIAVPLLDGGAAVVEGEVFRAAAAADASSIDPTVRFAAVNAVLPGVRRIDGAAWEVARSRAQAALASQLIGCSRAMLELAQVHALDRVQFGRPIASFQAVRHKLAETLVAIEGAAAVAHSIVDDSDPLLSMIAKSLAGSAARTTAKHCQQVLAGIGFTTDHRFHLFAKRAMVLDSLFGSAKSLPVEIGRELSARGGHAPRLVEL